MKGCRRRGSGKRAARRTTPERLHLLAAERGMAGPAATRSENPTAQPVDRRHRPRGERGLISDAAHWCAWPRHDLAAEVSDADAPAPTRKRRPPSRSRLDQRRAPSSCPLGGTQPTAAARRRRRRHALLGRPRCRPATQPRPRPGTRQDRTIPMAACQITRGSFPNKSRNHQPLRTAAELPEIHCPHAR